MKILVLGSNSFSGAHFVAHCLQHTDAEVVGISRSDEPIRAFRPYAWTESETKRFSFHRLDVNVDLDRLEAVIDEFEPSFVVNFVALGMVAESWQNPDQWLMTNTVSQVRLHDRLRRKAYLKKFLQVSTPEVYGNSRSVLTEHTPHNPSTPYAVSKSACDVSLGTFHEQYGFPVVFTRAANVYGPGQQLYRIIPRTVLAARTGRKLQLHGGGTSVRSFIHISDVCVGTLRALVTGEPPTVFHLATPNHLSIRELVTVVCDLADVRFEDVVEIVDERPGKDAIYELDCSLAREMLDWEPEVDLLSGLKETIDWVDANLSTLLECPSTYIHKP